MSFLAPLFLVGLVGLAIPVIVHLTRHERGKPLQFPSLMFLERIPFQETSRRRIRHWSLLLLRLAALALLVAAFARPFVRTGRLASRLHVWAGEPRKHESDGGFGSMS